MLQGFEISANYLNYCGFCWEGRRRSYFRLFFHWLVVVFSCLVVCVGGCFPSLVLYFGWFSVWLVGFIVWLVLCLGGFVFWFVQKMSKLMAKGWFGIYRSFEMEV